MAKGMRKLLSHVLTTLGMKEGPSLEATLNAMVALAKKYGLSVAGYEHAPGRAGGIVPPVPPVHAGATGKTPPAGHMLQIFVHRDWVNDAACPS